MSFSYPPTIPTPPLSLLRTCSHSKARESAKILRGQVILALQSRSQGDILHIISHVSIPPSSSSYPPPSLLSTPFLLTFILTFLSLFIHSTSESSPSPFPFPSPSLLPSLPFPSLHHSSSLHHSPPFNTPLPSTTLLPPKLPLPP